jgi:hypothetical protein
MDKDCMVCVCRRCGSWYWMDFIEALYCHYGDDDWMIVFMPFDEAEGDYCYLAPGFVEAYV